MTIKTVLTEVTYLGERDADPFSDGNVGWKNHAYNVLVTVTSDANGKVLSREADFRFYRGSGQPHEDPMVTSGERSTRRGGWVQNRDAEIAEQLLQSLASDLNMADQSDDELAEEFELKPSKIASIRVHITSIRSLFKPWDERQFIEMHGEETDV